MYRPRLTRNNSLSPTGLWFKSSSTSSEPEAKREHEVKTIGTHNGRFHCDEVLACYMLQVLPEYKDARYVCTCTCIMTSVSFRIFVKGGTKATIADLRGDEDYRCTSVFL